jgi:hypothetical protein
MLYGDDRVARVVELRKGEVIVDVDALLFELPFDVFEVEHRDALRAALRKVGKR